jgi:hypothetical protein
MRVSIDSNDEYSLDRLYETLEMKSEIIMNIPPYVTHAGQWRGIYSGIQTLIVKNV